VVSSVPKQLVSLALGTAGLTQAFSGLAGPDGGQEAFQKQSRVRLEPPAGFWYFHPDTNTKK